MNLEELKTAALALGYRLSKIPAKKAKASTDEDVADVDVALVADEKKSRLRRRKQVFAIVPQAFPCYFPSFVYSI